MLSGAGLSDQPGLAQPLGEKALAEDVVDLVGSGVGQILALEVDPNVEAEGFAQTISPIDGRRPAGVVRAQLAQLGPEGRIAAKRVIGVLELEQR